MQNTEPQVLHLKNGDDNTYVVEFLPGFELMHVNVW